MDDKNKSLVGHLKDAMLVQRKTITYLARRLHDKYQDEEALIFLGGGNKSEEDNSMIRYDDEEEVKRFGKRKISNQ